MARRTPRDERPIPAHPYRDSALVYGILAAVLVIVAVLTGSAVFRTVVVAAIFFVLATSWSSWNFRRRIRAQNAATAAKPPAGSEGDGGRASGNRGRSPER